jgi:ubiquinone/menaquinone biosynthesis C-methylase UbiE
MQLHRVPYLVYRISPGLGKISVRIWYQHITRFDKQHEMIFMNYGFAGIDDAPPPTLLGEDEADRYCIQLYHHLTGGIEMAGRDVLEVGSGRGGGSSYISRYLGPRSVTGLDVASRAIDYCAERHVASNLRFVQGDAESLPFGGDTFDVVINVESSHYYASMPRFLSEVRRVLRPGGFLLFADFRAGRGLDTLRRQVAGSGFEVVREELITANVLRALQLDEERKLALINSKVPWLVRKVFKEFASTRGSATYESFHKRHWEYISFILRKRGVLTGAHYNHPRAATPAPQLLTPG